MKRFLAIFTLFCTVFHLLADDDEDKLKLAVMEFEDQSGKLSPKMLSSATEYIRGAFVASNKFIVIAKERQENAMIKQMKKESYKLCNDKNCQIPLGQALSADTILRTTITFLGGQYTITSELIDLAKEATTKGAKATFNGDEKSLIPALDEIVSQIIGRRNKKSEFQTGRFGGKSDDWEIGGGEETIVKFESEPTGAVVIADGKIICQSTPCSKLLTQGNHEIEMQKENYVPNSQKQNIKEGKPIKYKLEPDFAWLTVTGNYAVSLKLDGANIGNIPIKEKPISAGNHRIEHTNGCYYDFGETFTVKRGEKKNIKFDLEHRESAIKVYAQDEKGNDINADVFVDDKKIGRAPGTFKVPLCSKKLLVKKSGYGDYSERLSLQEKQVKTFQAKMRSDKPANHGDVGSNSGSMPKEIGNMLWSNKSPNTMSWNTAKQYCKNLSEGGFSDWRLPTISELKTTIKNCDSGTSSCGVSDNCLLADCGASRKCGCDYKKNNGGYYSKLGDDDNVTLWSSSDYSVNTNYVWGVVFGSGRVDGRVKDSSMYMYVRCVHPMKDKNGDTDSNKNSISDSTPKKIGNLQWSNKTPIRMKWSAAKQYCTNLSEDGYSDWRLPNIDELRTLIKNCPKTETGGDCKVSEKNGRLSLNDWDQSCSCDMKENNEGYYSKLGDDDEVRLFSSSTLPDSPEEAWFVVFGNGFVNVNRLGFPHHVRCVRDAK